MNRRFLISAFVVGLCTAVSAQEPAALWGKAVQAAKKFTQGSDMKMGADGSLYIIGTGSTRTVDDYITLGGAQLALGTVYRGTNDNSQVTMMYLTKLDGGGSPSWTVYSKDAQASANNLVLQPVADGVVAFFVVEHTEKGGDHSPCFIDGTDATGNSHSLGWTLESAEASRYFKGVLMKVGSGGDIKWLRVLEPTDPSNQGLYPNAIAADDDGNLWIAGRQRVSFLLPKSDGTTETVAPSFGSSGDGSPMLVKLDADGYYLNHLEASGSASNMYVNRLVQQGSQLYLMGIGSGSGTVSLGDKSTSFSGACPYTASVNTDMTVNWVQAYPSSVSCTIQEMSLTAAGGSLWVTGTAKLELTTKTGKQVTTGTLNRDAVLLRIDAANGDLLDGYAKGKLQQGYFSTFMASDGYLYAVGHQGVWAGSEPKMPNGGAMFIDKFSPSDLTASVGSWDNVLENAAGAQTALLSPGGTLYTMTRSQQTSNALMGGPLTTGQTTGEYSCNLCAFQLPVTPAPTGIRDITHHPSPNTPTWYNLQGQRVQKPAKGLYIHEGRKVVVKD